MNSSVMKPRAAVKGLMFAVRQEAVTGGTYDNKTDTSNGGDEYYMTIDRAEWGLHVIFSSPIMIRGNATDIRN